MNSLKSESSLYLIPMIVVISAMYDSLSFLSLIFWAIGISMTFTVLNRKGVGIIIMNNTKRRIVLGIGMTITIISLLDEISVVAFISFSIGFMITIFAIEKTNNEKKND